MPGLSAVIRLVVPVLLLAACSAEAAPTTLPPPPLERLAASYAATAERAIADTAFTESGADIVAAALVELCEGLGGGAVAAVSNQLGPTAPDGDVAIMEEVLTVGITQVCPERGGTELSRIFVDAVAGAVQAADGSVFDEPSAVRAASVACTVLSDGEGADAALVAIAASMFDLAVADAPGLEGALDPEQGVVVGAVLAAAAAMHCPQHAAAVQSFLEDL